MPSFFSGAVELDYVATINRVLPLDIRVVAWAPVPVPFDARYENGSLGIFQYLALMLSVVKSVIVDEDKNPIRG